MGRGQRKPGHGMSTALKSARELAAEFGCSKRKVQDLARSLGIGANFGGAAGYRFSEADKQAILEALRPVAPVARRRRRSA